MRSLFINARAAIRFLLFVFFVLIYFLISGVVSIFTNDLVLRRRRQTVVCSEVCKLILKAFNITLLVKNPIDKDEASLLVGNHVGFIDIVCLQAIQPSVFITSTDMKNTPVLGQICDLGGCAYVNRQSRMKIHEELKDIVRVLKEGFRVVLYAESVASNGEQVLPFKKTLLMAAGLSGRPIRPLVFNFLKVNNEDVQFQHRDSVCWYGDQTFLPAIWRSLQLNSVVCEIEFLPLVFPTPETDRTELSTSLHKTVSEKYRPFVPSL